MAKITNTRTYGVHAEELDGFATVTIVFGSAIQASRLATLDKEAKKFLTSFFGPDSEVELADAPAPKK